MTKLRESWESVSQFRSNSQQHRILEGISAGDLFVGFLSSAGSSRLMQKTAQARAMERHRNKRALGGLKKAGYIQTKKKDGEEVYFITKEGKHALHHAYAGTGQALLQSKKWDNVWRVITYDFPEQERSSRNSLRYVLSKAQFFQVQKSVWVFPHDSALLFELLSKNEAVSAHIILMKAKSASLDVICKKHFGLR